MQTSTKYLSLHLPEGEAPKLYPKYTRPLKALEVNSPVASKVDKVGLSASMVIRLNGLLLVFTGKKVCDP